MLRIARDLLDQQIIDVNGRKVVRVNDVTFELRQGQRHRRCSPGCSKWISACAACCAGFCRAGSAPLDPLAPAADRSAFHSLGVLQYRRARSAAPAAPQHLDTDKLESLHPADLADIVEELGPEERERYFRNASTAKWPPTPCRKSIRRCRPAFWNRWIPKRPPISSRRWRPTKPRTSWPNWKRRPPKKSSRRWRRSPRPTSQELLEYEEDTAGGMMNTDYVAVPENATVTDAMAAIRAATRICSKA